MTTSGDGPATGTSQDGSSATGPRPEGLAERARRDARKSKSWAGYAWFMTGGTFFPLPMFLGGYLINLSLVGAPVARRVYGCGLFLSTMGQPPPGKDKLASAQGKKPLVERIRPYSPPGLVARYGKPVPRGIRAVWFVLVGWWLGALWVLLAWSVLLLPYPLLDLIRSLIDDLPSVLTLAPPSSARPLPEAASD